MQKKIPLIILFIFILIGLYLRINGTLGGFFAFSYDQGRDLLLVYDLINRGKITLIGPSTGIPGLFHGVWWYWLILPFFWIFSGNPTLIVASFNILSLSVIILAFIAGKSIKNYSLGLIMAGITAFSAAFVGIGAQLWNPNMVPVFTIGLILSLWNYLTNKHSFIWVGIFLGLIFEFHTGFGAMLFIALGLSLLILKLLPNIKELIKGLLGFGIWLIPGILFDIRHKFLQSGSLINYFLHPQTKNIQLDILIKFKDRWLQAFNVFITTFSSENKIIGGVILITVIICMIKIFRLSGSKNLKKYFQTIILTIVLLLVVASIYPNTLWDYYLVGLPALFLPITASALELLIERNKIIGTFVNILLLIFIMSPWKNFNNQVWQGDAAVYKNQMGVVEAVYKKAENRPFNVAVYSPSMIDYNYQYLFQWYGQKHYGYTPDRQNVLPLAFFIIEPDPWNQLYKKAWLSEREGDGTIVWKQKFPGEIEVEKRERTL